MKIAVLTSSRADFGIYLPLLNELKSDPYFDLEIIAFGTHLSKYHGYTIDEILKQGFEVNHRISSLLLTDDPSSISTAYALTALKFADFWGQKRGVFDWVFCLGDRFEMAAAVAAGIPFNIPFAHLFGGETTLGAIDNIYRHSITIASKLHFVSTEPFKERVKELINQNAEIVVTGSLSLENLKSISLLTIQQFEEKWNINLNIPCILVTIHPETVAFDKNQLYADQAFKALQELIGEYQVIITMPNADTSGTIFRKAFEELKINNPGRVHLIENFGTQSYFTCMKYADIVVGNSSSGIVEAASFGKYVINIGNRQKGRLAGDNVIHVQFKASEIIGEVNKFNGKRYLGDNLYFKQNAVGQIIKQLKK